LGVHFPVLVSRQKITLQLKSTSLDTIRRMFMA